MGGRHEAQDHVKIEVRDHPGATRIWVGGNEVLDVRAIHVALDAESFPKVVIEYPCYTFELDGETNVVHYCPVTEEKADVFPTQVLDDWRSS